MSSEFRFDHTCPSALEAGWVMIDNLRAALAERGGQGDIWVIYIEDERDTALEGFRLTSHAAFWTRGEAYSFAWGHHAGRASQHCYVFRLAADAHWAMGEEARRLEFETVFGRAVTSASSS